MKARQLPPISRIFFHMSFLLLSVTFTPGCSDSSNTAIDIRSGLYSCADSGSCASNPILTIGGDRPAGVLIPSNYTPGTRYPLIVMLHGVNGSGTQVSRYAGTDVRVDERQYILVAPDGSVNSRGRIFWSTLAACCGVFEGDDEIDDVAYIRSLLEEAIATYSIDEARIGVIGVSNGGFMAMTMVCKASDIITSAIAFNGSTFAEASSCSPATDPVSVLTVHAVEDTTIFYDGGIVPRNGRSYPGALERTDRFATLAGCDKEKPVVRPDIDLTDAPGHETEVILFSDCDENVEVALWTITAGGHTPRLSEHAPDTFIDWILGHSRD